MMSNCRLECGVGTCLTPDRQSCRCTILCCCRYVPEVIIPPEVKAQLRPSLFSTHRECLGAYKEPWQYRVVVSLPPLEDDKDTQGAGRHEALVARVAAALRLGSTESVRVVRETKERPERSPLKERPERGTAACSLSECSTQRSPLSHGRRSALRLTRPTRGAGMAMATFHSTQARGWRCWWR